MISQRKIFLGLLLCLILPSCASSGSNGKSDNLKEHQQTWQKQDISNYQFTLAMDCFCPQGLSPATIIVRNDTVSAVLDPKTDKALLSPNTHKPVLKQLPNYYPTIDKLFGIIQKAIQQNYVHLDVKYNSEYGYPKNIDMEQSKQVTDDAISYTVSNFEPLKTSK